MELMEEGSLQQVLHSDRTLAWSQRVKMAKGIAAGLAYLHGEGIVHRDIKSMNVLLNSQLEAKLSDFGLAKVKTSTLTMTAGFMGTPQWSAPELFGMGTKCNFTTDVFALGVVFWELCTREMPFKEAENLMSIAMHVATGGRETIPSSVPSSFSDLISRCWTQNPQDRPTSDEVLNELN
jgi:serine/threonine protein kinase